jgi:sugar phosphate isomerase/epimerase
MLAIGVMLNNLERDRLRAFAVARAEGFAVVHTNALPESMLTGPQRQQYMDAARASGVQIATMFIGFDGQSYADRAAVAGTVGLLAIPELRSHRLQIALAYCALAKELGVSALAMHLGFLPPDRSHADYSFLIAAVRQILDRCADNGQSLQLETGQESATELRTFIEEVDRPNLGVNFDPANFLLYDTDEPLTALDTLAPYLRGVHCKDGRRPTQPEQLGEEVPLGQGEINWPGFLQKLQQMGYPGPLIIERESGPNVRAEVQQARQFLEDLLAELER